MEVLLWVGVAAAAGGFVWLSWYLKKKRREGLAAAARQLGLEYSPSDPFATLGLPFALFSRGEGRGVENVVWGTWQGLEVREFDYWYYTEHTDSKGNRTRSYSHFSCALAEIPAVCPPITIAREGVFSRLADHLGFRDVEYESEEFNRRFQVKTPERKFAFELVDARMMQWLLSLPERFNFEVVGPWVLCFGGRRRPTEMVPLLGTLKGFVERVPRVVPALYPNERAAGSG